MLRSLLICLLLPLSDYAQTTYHGTVSDAGSQLPVAFATVGLIKENTGTTTGEDGHFNLTTSKPQPGDTLLFTALGYQPQKIATAAFSGKVALVKNVREIGEVAVKPKNWKRLLLLNKHDKDERWGSQSTDGSVSQVAQHYTIPATPASLEKATVYVNYHPIFAPHKGRFRLRIYGLDVATGGPGEDLCSQSIEVRGRSGKISIDLKPYQITLLEKDFFIAVEWLRIPENEYVVTDRINALKSIKKTLYYPSPWLMGQKADGANNCWMKDFSGQWKQFRYRLALPSGSLIGNYSIEARVRY